MVRDRQNHKYRLEEIALMNQGKVIDTATDGEYRVAAVRARPATKQS